MRALTLIPVLFGLQSIADKIISRNFPHLIIPVSKLEPARHFDTTTTVDVERDIWTEILFDVPNNTATWCAIGFSINLDPNLNAPWKLWGDEPYIFIVSALAQPPGINKDTDTWAQRPPEVEPVATVEVWANGTSTIYGGQLLACPKGQTAQFLLHPADRDRLGGLTWYELNYTPPHGITYDMYAPE